MTREEARKLAIGDHYYRAELREVIEYTINDTEILNRFFHASEAWLDKRFLTSEEAQQYLDMITIKRRLAE